LDPGRFDDLDLRKERRRSEACFYQLEETDPTIAETRASPAKEAVRHARPRLQALDRAEALRRRQARLQASTPAERRSHVGQDRLGDVRVVGDAKLVGDRQEQSVGLRDGLVCLELFDKNVWLGGIAATEDRACLFVDKADLVLSSPPRPK